MEHQILTVPEMLIDVKADIDQCQALIDQARVAFANDPHFQLTLDRKQTQLDERRERVRIMDDIAKIVYHK